MEFRTYLVQRTPTESGPPVHCLVCNIFLTLLSQRSWISFPEACVIPGALPCPVEFGLRNKEIERKDSRKSYAYDINYSNLTPSFEYLNVPNE